MANLTRTPATQAGNGPRAGATKTAAPVATRSFADAAVQHAGTIGYEVLEPLSTSQKMLRTLQVPSSGYLRAIVLLIELIPAANNGVFQATFGSVANVLVNTGFDDVTGSSIISSMSGRELSTINALGGHVGFGPVGVGAEIDPLVGGLIASATSSGFVRYPLEIGENDGYGAVANMDSAQSYRIPIQLRALSEIYSTVPTGGASVKITAIAESWLPPAANGPDGVPNEQTPPALGTTQFHSKIVQPFAAGENVRIPCPRVGNYLRSMYLWFGPSNGAPDEAYVPTTLRAELNSRVLFNAPKSYLRHLTFERCGLPLAALTPGLIFLDWAHEADGRVGYENRTGYLPTAASDDLSFYGTFASSGAVTMIVNDIATAGA